MKAVESHCPLRIFALVRESLVSADRQRRMRHGCFLLATSAGRGRGAFFNGTRKNSVVILWHSGRGQPSSTSMFTLSSYAGERQERWKDSQHSLQGGAIAGVGKKQLRSSPHLQRGLGSAP